MTATNVYFFYQTLHFLHTKRPKKQDSFSSAKINVQSNISPMDQNLQSFRSYFPIHLFPITDKCLKKLKKSNFL